MINKFLISTRNTLEKIKIENQKSDKVRINELESIINNLLKEVSKGNSEDTQNAF